MWWEKQETVMSWNMAGFHYRGSWALEEVTERLWNMALGDFQDSVALNPEQPSLTSELILLWAGDWAVSLWRFLPIWAILCLEPGSTLHRASGNSFGFQGPKMDPSTLVIWKISVYLFQVTGFWSPEGYGKNFNIHWHLMFLSKNVLRVKFK